jgi:hypothetical protein
LSSCVEAGAHVLARGLSSSTGEVHRKGDGCCHRLGDAFSSLSHVFGLLAFLASSGPAPFGYRPFGLLDLSLRVLNALNDSLGLLVAERFQDGRKEFLLFVAPSANSTPSFGVYSSWKLPG